VTNEEGGRLVLACAVLAVVDGYHAEGDVWVDGPVGIVWVEAGVEQSRGYMTWGIE